LTVDPAEQIEARRDLVFWARRMLRSGLVKGTSGNFSRRLGEGGPILVTPSGVDYDSMQPEDLVEVDLAGGTRPGSLKPSVDTQVHLAIYRARPEVGAVAHTHSPHAAVFSVLRRAIPSLLTEPAGFLGGAVRVIDYVPPAREDTGPAVAEGLGRDRAILLPHHGVIAVGEHPAKAFQAAMAVEESAQVAYLAALLGDPEPVPEAEVSRMNEFIHHRYGQR
jgi:L-ribulose-5-phosphate 4-epimerase